MAVFLRFLTILFALVLMAGSATAALAQATATPAATPANCVILPSGVRIELANPQPGDTLLSGTQVVLNGVAFDTGSTSGPGILSVTAYLGARDAGGLALGTAILGQPNPNVPSGSPLATAGFTLRTPALPTGSGGRSIFVYARSQVGNAEGVLEVPIFLNAAPTPVRGEVPTPVVTPLPACTPTPIATATPTSTATPVAPPAAPAVQPAVSPVALATATPFPTLPPVLPAVPPAAPAASPVAAPAPAAPSPAAAPTTAQTPAPRGGGIPPEIGLLALAVGGIVVGGGLAMRRRERRG